MIVRPPLGSGADFFFFDTREDFLSILCQHRKATMEFGCSKNVLLACVIAKSYQERDDNGRFQKMNKCGQC